MSNDYWNRRRIKDKARSVNRSEDYIRKEQAQLYKKAQEELKARIEKLYQSFANQEGISLADAKRKISSADFKKIDFDGMVQELQMQMKALKGGVPKELLDNIEAQHEELLSEIRTYSRRGSISYLEQKSMEIDKILVDLYDNQQLSMYDFLRNEWDDGYYRNVYHTQQRIGFGYDFVKPNERAVRQAVMQTFDKRNFSRTTYQNCKNFSKDLKENLITGLIRGESLEKISSRLRKRLDVSASRARTLVRTETANIFEQATMAGYKAAGIEWYEILATLDNKTTEICRSLDGTHYRLKDAVVGKNYPPMHPNCRSTTVVWFPNEEQKKSQTTRIAKSDSGKYYEVPADMTYEKWRGKTNVGKEEFKSLKIEFPDDIVKVNGITKKIKKELDDAMKKLQNEYDIRFEEISVEKASPGDVFITGYYNGKMYLVVNKSLNIERFKKTLVTQYNDGYFASKSMEDVLAHESAHCMLYQDCKTDAEYRAKYKQIENLYPYLKGISGYGDRDKSGNEALAEAFVRVRNGEEVPPMAKILVKSYFGGYKK